MKYRDYPFDEIAKAMVERIEEGYEFYQKFSCEKCGARLTMPEANIMYIEGTCDQCGHATNIRERGCNYLLRKIHVIGEDL